MQIATIPAGPGGFGADVGLSLHLVTHSTRAAGFVTSCMLPSRLRRPAPGSQRGMNDERSDNEQEELPGSVSNQNNEEAEPGHGGGSEKRSGSAGGGSGQGGEAGGESEGESSEGSQSTGDPNSAG